ncbi:MAG TPA: hypothetical protein VFG14_18390, partial [Chthoniobacteraceae bacterium]|nr:hypothetical protein [Chthoniobacteraceae bacterium]
MQYTRRTLLKSTGAIAGALNGPATRVATTDGSFGSPPPRSLAGRCDSVFMPEESTFRRVMMHLRTRLLGQEVTLYPSYGYPDPRDPETWIVPMRAWVHDNRDTPFAEKAFERLAVRHFEGDLNRPLEEKEKARLEKILE